jgi:ABC-type antimicrobial peptide transport system permease subunit
VIAGAVLASMLPETARFDATVVAGAIGLLVVTAAVAAAIPASRVLRLNPLALLRHA